MAPLGTRVLAAAPGKVESLFQSEAGGNTIYVRSEDGQTIYYRLATPGHPERWEATFLDPFTEYEPVRRAASGISRGT